MSDERNTVVVVTILALVVTWLTILFPEVAHPTGGPGELLIPRV